jgi:hypothetical protein
MHASKLVSASVIFTGIDDPNVARFDVVLGKGGSGGGNPLVHVHPLAEERFLVTSGRIKVVLGGRPHQPRRLGLRFCINSDSERRALPTASKLWSDNQALMISRTSGHSSSNIEYHAVSRFLPFDTI